MKEISYPLVEEVATQNVIMLEVNSTFGDTVDLITEKGIRNIVVEDHDVEVYAYIGINEIVKYISENIDINTPLSSLGLHPLVMIPRTHDVFDASSLFLHDISLLGVTNNDGSLFGVLSHFDILSVGAKMSEHLMESPIEVLVLNTNIIKCTPQTVLNESLFELSDPKMDCIIVEEDKKPIGIITKRDITKLRAEKRDLNQVVSGYMNAPLLTFPHTISIREALQSIQEKGHKRILVTSEDGSLFGVITEQALINLIYNRLAQKTTIGIDKFNNILDQKLQEKIEENKLLQERYELALSVTDDGIWDWDLEKGSLYISHQWKNMLGYNNEDIKEGSFELWASLVHPDDLEYASTKATELGEGKLTKYEVEFRMRCKDGTYKWILSRAKSVEKNSDGIPSRIVGTHTDITKRKEAQEKLIEKEKEQAILLSLFDKGDSHLFKWNNDTNWSVKHVSKNIVNLLGYTSDEFLSHQIDYAECIHPDDIDNVSLEVQNTIKNNLDFFKHKPYRIITKDGSLKWVLDYTATQKNENNEITHFIGYINDITQLKEQEAQFETLFDNTQMGLMFISADRTLIRANPRLAEICGYESAEEMVGLSMRDFHISEENFINFGKKYFEKLIYGSQINVEYQIKRKDGSTIWIAISGRAIDNNTPANLDQGVIWSLHDLSDRKELELEVIKQKDDIESLKNAFDEHSIVAITDIGGKIIAVNQKFIDLTGYSEEELLGENHRILNSGLQPKEYWKEVYEKISQGKVWNDLIRNVRKDGEYYWVDTTIVPFFKNGALVNYISIRTDVTELKNTEEKLTSAKEKAELISQFKSDFLANMSHEIRTPMNGILGFVEQLQKHETDKDRLNQFNMIRSSGNTLLNIINDILDFSKIESGKMEVELHPFSLYNVVSEITTIFQELLNSKNIQFHKECDENIPPCILGDETRVKQIIFNLLSNAIKFTPEGGKIDLNTKLDTLSKQVRIAISDTGIGIAENKVERIFEAFVQTDTSTTRKYGGTGLGLSIANSLIRKMGGKIEVESKLKEGSIFTIVLPLKECDEKEKEFIESKEDASQENISFDGHVLIVEDNKTNQMLLSMMLDDLGLTYDIANDGVEGLECFTENKYDIILMDENMPNLNGIEATNQIRLMEYDNEDTPIPIVAVTANALAEDRQRFIDAGLDEYVSKPYTEEDIVRVLKKYLHT